MYANAKSLLWDFCLSAFHEAKSHCCCMDNDNVCGIATVHIAAGCFCFSQPFYGIGTISVQRATGIFNLFQQAMQTIPKKKNVLTIQYYLYYCCYLYLLFVYYHNNMMFVNICEVTVT